MPSRLHPTAASTRQTAQQVYGIAQNTSTPLRFCVTPASGDLRHLPVQHDNHAARKRRGRELIRIDFAPDSHVTANPSPADNAFLTTYIKTSTVTRGVAYNETADAAAKKALHSTVTALLQHLHYKDSTSPSPPSFISS
ncbi:hypothetical protein O3P69_012298 [Scylla paramamosain]|uniref:Uncharacterized protein n=1 Tax=Scylla paramamosain TaxID=85552 RepID=A0AAW0TEX2_SCYPA